MFTRINLFLGTMAFALALSAFSQETQAGRYRVEAPVNAGTQTAQTGRYRVAVDNSAFANQTQNNWATIGQNRVAGRYQPSQLNVAPASAFFAEPAYAQMKTGRGAAMEVSNKPAAPEHHDHK